MTDIIKHTDNQLTTIQQAAQVADTVAARNTLTDYRNGLAPNTIRAQDRNLARFEEFLCETTGEPIAGLNEAPGAWAAISWGLAKAYQQWMLQAGYAISTVNHALSTVKVYAKLANQAGTLNTDTLLRIRAITAISRKQAKHINTERDVTRLGDKKREHTSLTLDAARKLKRMDADDGIHPDTPQGRRDAVLMSFLLDFGLRAGEMALIQVSDIDLKDETLRFYRPKVDKHQTFRLTRDTRRALKAYSDAGDMPATGRLLRGSRKGGKLTHAGMSERGISKRVNALADSIGIDGVSAHDLRHYCMTDAARNGTGTFELQEFGGWASLAMPRRYVEEQTIANEAVKQSG